MAVPYSYNIKDSLTVSSIQNVTSYSLPSYNNENLQNYSDSIITACEYCGHKNYYAYGNRLQIDLKVNAQYYNDSIFGGKLWIYKIKSQTALGLQLYFSKLILPERSNLYIYSSDKTQVYGPFTSADNPLDTNKAIHFGIPPIIANEIYIEYFQHDSADFNGKIVIDNIAHIFNTSPISISSNQQNAKTLATTSGPGLCNKDVACTVGWEKEINSVALIYIYDTQNNMIGTCSGALINNTAGDGYPYFLTAAHCFDENNTTYDPSTWQFVFDYQSSYCANNNNVSNVPHQWIYGSTVLSKDPLTIYQNNLYGQNSDYLLLELNTTASIIQQLGICYAGWSYKDALSSPIFNNNYAVFGHPQASTKKATFGSNLIAYPNFTAVMSPSDFYKFDITLGTLEPGSSGSPLFNNNHKIIGTYSFYQPLLSQVDFCDYTSFNCGFGRFSRHWVLGQFKQYLDPLNLTNNVNYDGPSSYCPYSSGQSVGIGGPVTSGFPTGQFLDAGFKINGKVGTPVICNTNLTLTPLVANHFKIAIYSKSAPCSDAWGLGTWADGCGGKKILGIKYNCYCRYYSYQVDVEELDYNFNTVASGSKVYENKWGMSGAFGYFSYGIVSSVNIDLNNFGLTINPGHYYKIGLQTSSGGTWYYSSRIVYVLPYDVIVNNSTISNDIYSANSITLINSTVPLNANKNFAASNLVQIKQNSTLKSGKYYIQNIDCNTFRLSNEDTTIPTSNKNVVSNQSYYFENNQLYKYSANINPIKISPNPTSYSSSITIPIENNSHVSSLLYDVNGKLLFKIIEETINSKGNFEADILTKDLSTGIYFIKTTVNDKLYSNKLVVNHE